MNSGYHWPYGRREGVLPIWAHRRAAAPDVPGQFPRVIFQKRPEGFASRWCEDSTPDTYFCLAFSGNANKDGLDAVSCPSQFNSDKGRLLRQADVAAGYSEPAELDGQSISRPLDLTSLYPPRRDFTACDLHGELSPCMGGINGCQDHPDAATFADAARRAMPDIDAVTMATPPPVEQTVLFSVPDNWPTGDYVAWMEVNTEGDYNQTYNAATFPTPMMGEWDSYAKGTGYPYRGQPSVVFKVPFSLDGPGSFTTAVPAGFGSVDGLEPDANQMHAMDATITNDPAGAPGSGADRLRLSSSGARLTIEVRDQAFCKDHAAPEAPGAFSVAPAVEEKHSHEWGRLHFVVPPSALPIAAYEVRFSTKPISPGDETSFVQGVPAVAATTKGEALMIAVDGAPGTSVDVDFGGLAPATHYWVALRAVDVCNRAGPHVVGELTTTRVAYTQLSGCFVATAAWGSALQPQVDALRRARDRLLPESSLFAVATELYYRAGPAAAAVIRRSDVARTLARLVIGPIGTTASAVRVTDR
jgi:hypothetical protein